MQSFAEEMIQMIQKKTGASDDVQSATPFCYNDLYKLIIRLN